MDRSVLGDTEIEAVLKKDFVYVRIDVDKSADLARLYGVRGFPYSWFLGPSGERIVEVPGYVQTSLFKKVLRYVKDGYYRTSDVNDYLKKR